MGVDLVLLALRGLSHGVCLACMPTAFGHRAFSAYLEHHPEAICEVCVIGQKVQPEGATFGRDGCNRAIGGVNA
jgi:hypothetical protein